MSKKWPHSPSKIPKAPTQTPNAPTKAPARAPSKVPDIAIRAPIESSKRGDQAAKIPTYKGNEGRGIVKKSTYRPSTYGFGKAAKRESESLISKKEGHHTAKGKKICVPELRARGAIHSKSRAFACGTVQAKHDRSNPVEFGRKFPGIPPP